MAIAASAPVAAAGSAPGFGARERWILAGIFALALALRLLHLNEIRLHDPFFEIPAVDGRLYHAQAQAIARGDLGEGVLFLGPLYPWFLALVYRLFGVGLLSVKTLQAALGAFDCVLVAMLARLYFGRGVALLAAGFAAVYRMLVFYGGTLMIVNLLVPLVLLSAICVTRALREPSSRRWLGAGCVVSLATLGRQNMLLYAVLIGAWLWWDLRLRVDRPQRARQLAAFSLGVCLLIAPFSLRNYAVGGDLVLLNSTGGINLYMGNNERSNGAWVPADLGMRADSPTSMQVAFARVAERETGHSLRPSEVSSYWSGRARDWVIEHPVDWLVLELRKLLLFWNVREVWNNRSIDISRDFSWVLRLPLLGFGVVAPLALVGLGLSRSRWRELFPLYAMIAVYLASALLFFVLSRYRIPVVPVLMVFAAHAVVEAIRLARDRSWALLALVLAWTAVAGVVVHRDMGSENLYMAYFNVGNRYRELGRFDEAIASYQKSLAISPGFLGTHNNLALAYEGAGRRQEAIEVWRGLLAWSLKHGDAPRAERARLHLRDLGDPAASPPP